MTAPTYDPRASKWVALYEVLSVAELGTEITWEHASALTGTDVKRSRGSLQRVQRELATVGRQVAGQSKVGFRVEAL